SHFVWAARRAGRDVVVLDDGSANTSPPLPDGVEVVRGDVGDAAALAALFARTKARAVVHFAGLIQVGESVRRPEAYFDTNLVKGLRMLEAARAAGVTELVFSSTAAVYGEPERVPIPEELPKKPVNPYGASKLAFEYALEAYEKAHGFTWAALRYFNAAGADPGGKLREAHDPETHLVPLVIDAALGRRGPLTVFGDDYPTEDGTCVRDYIHVNDLAAAHLAALDRLDRGETVGALNLGTGRGSSVREVLDAVARVVGKPVPHAIGARRDGDPARLVADPARAKHVLGFTAARSDLETIVEDALRSRT
ncbi:MAG TPA: UDP-glucose 4-epimerase GalE, partial [Minicystis sp.]|nr:UDP-glucose 4-epimerase GalE [Minicystis sp.]